MKGIAGLSELHALGYGNPAIKIAVLDGPANLQHTCFNTDEGNFIPWTDQGVKFSSSSGLALNHGTAVCSMIFGKPGSPVEGVAPGCSGLIIPIYHQNQKGNFSPASQVDLARAIKIAITQGANIINISGGEFSKSGDPDFFLKQAIDECTKAGVLIIAAAGNEGCSCLHVPAADKNVLAVGSMDETGNPTSETNFGAHYQINGILVQGKNQTAALAGGETFQTNGATSYATPIISGIAGLLMSLQIQKGLKPDAYAIKSILEKTAIPCINDGGNDCRRFLRGKLNLPGAIAAITENPGILASGLEFANAEKNTSIALNTKSENNKEIISCSRQRSELLPSALTIQAAMGPHPKNSQMIMPSENPEKIMTDPVGKDALMPASELTETITLKLTRDGPAVNPSEEVTTFSENNNSNKIIKNLNNQKMENNTKNQNADAPATLDCVNPSAVINPSADITPSDCGCGCGGKKEGNGENGGNGNGAAMEEPSTLVYALGTLGYDFGSEAHQDSFLQSMGGGNPNEPAAILKYLKESPWAAEELTWTLNIDSTPIYALYPTGTHSQQGYERIRLYLSQQESGNIQRISVPGISQGSTQLLNGYTVANLMPNLRGMYSWTTEALTAAATGAKGSNKALAENVSNFLNRVYYEMRNLGVSPQERALNYAATNAYQVSAVFASALKENLELNIIKSEKSPICRPGSDCYDVTLSFFNPKERLTQARKEYRFTIDVSDVVPVTVGEVRAWSVYD